MIFIFFTAYFVFSGQQKSPPGGGRIQWFVCDHSCSVSSQSQSNLIVTARSPS